MNQQHRPAERDDPVDGPINEPAKDLIDEHADAASEQIHVPPLPPAGRTEIGGPGGLEPTRYGDWERNGRCFDF